MIFPASRILRVCTILCISFCIRRSVRACFRFFRTGIVNIGCIFPRLFPLRAFFVRRAATAADFFGQNNFFAPADSVPQFRDLVFFFRRLCEIARTLQAIVAAQSDFFHRLGIIQNSKSLGNAAFFRVRDAQGVSSGLA